MPSILLVDDHSIIRSALKILFGNELPLYSFDEADNGNTALEKILTNDYALIILDISIPGTDAFHFAQTVLKAKPASRILIFSMSEEHIYAKRFLKIGAKGYIGKYAPASQLKEAVLSILDDHKYISPSMSEYMADEIASGNSENPFSKLSPKQTEIATYLINGKSISDICSIMNLHSSTISTQKNRIFQKLRITNMMELYNFGRAYL
jgi:two-component system, NarL family, invasion response regulator UvrY